MGKSKTEDYVSFPASLLRVKQRRQLVSLGPTGTRGRNSCPEPHKLMRNYFSFFCMRRVQGAVASTWNAVCIRAGEINSQDQSCRTRKSRCAPLNVFPFALKLHP